MLSAQFLVVNTSTIRLSAHSLLIYGIYNGGQYVTFIFSFHSTIVELLCEPV